MLKKHSAENRPAIFNGSQSLRVVPYDPHIAKN